MYNLKLASRGDDAIVVHANAIGVRLRQLDPEHLVSFAKLLQRNSGVSWRSSLEAMFEEFVYPEGMGQVVHEPSLFNANPLRQKSEVHQEVVAEVRTTPESLITVFCLTAPMASMMSAVSPFSERSSCDCLV